MRNDYYDMPLPEEEIPHPSGLPGEGPAENGPAPEPLSPWPAAGSGTPPPPIYEETVPPPGGEDRPLRRRENRGILVFCAAILLIAAGLITLVAVYGLSPTLELPDASDSFSSGDGFDFNFDFTLPDQSSGTSETTIERAPLGADVELTLEPVPDGEELTYQEIYEKVLPSVVGIRALGPSGGATGTGVVLSEDGYIITNFHVIEGASTAAVVLQDGGVYEALLVGGDAANDLAVLKIDVEGLTPAEFGDSSLLRVGDVALAIGNPLGEELAGTMTDGIVSAINRDVNVDGISMTLIQTTAALNSGNSGGALINIYGQVVGITNMKMSSRYSEATVEGLGFAIPTVTVKAVVEELIGQGFVAGRPTLGITVQTPALDGWSAYTLPDDFEGGILVVEVQPGSDAYEKGVQAGDIIVEANGTPIRENNDLLEVKNALEVGDTVTLRIWREDHYLEIDVELIEQYELDNIK